MDCDLSALVKASDEMFMDDEESEGDIENDSKFFEKEFSAYKRNYYFTKLGYLDFNE